MAPNNEGGADPSLTVRTRNEKTRWTFPQVVDRDGRFDVGHRQPRLPSPGKRPWEEIQRVQVMTTRELPWQLRCGTRLVQVAYQKREGMSRMSVAGERFWDGHGVIFSLISLRLPVWGNDGGVFRLLNE